MRLSIRTRSVHLGTELTDYIRRRPALKFGRFSSRTASPVFRIEELNEAVIPGRCAAPPAPAIITRTLRPSVVVAYSSILSGVRSAETTWFS